MPRIKQFDEQDILNKTMHLFWKKGYTATSMQDLVDHLNISRASIYNTFVDKDTLFKRSFEHYRKTNVEALTCFFNTQPLVKEGFMKLLERGIDESVNDADRKGCFVVNTTTELIPGDRAMLKILEENKITLNTLFFQYLKKGETKGQISPGRDLKAIASFIYTLYSGLRVIAKVEPNKAELMQSVTIALAVLD